MKSDKALDEARKYLLYVSDALNAVAQAYSTDREDRTVLAKYAEDLFKYSDGLEQLKNRIVSKDQMKRKIQVVAELESTYESKKRVTEKAQTNLRIIKAVLKKAEEFGIKADIEEAERRVAHYTSQHTIAQQNELNAKRDFEQGA